MTPSLYITRSRHPRPAATRVAFCDGGVDASYRDGMDIELSHWIPNRTPAAFKASSFLSRSTPWGSRSSVSKYSRMIELLSRPSTWTGSDCNVPP